MIIIPFVIIGAIVIVISIILVRMIVAPKRVHRLQQLYKQNRIPSAIKLAKQLLSKDSRNHEAHYYLGLCYLADNKPELALMELKHVNQIGIFEGEIHEYEFRQTIADLYTRFNQHEDAQAEYLLLIKMNPEDANLYYQCGKLFELRNHPEKAVKYYQKTIELDKRHADAYGRLGSILYRAKRLPEAREALEQSVRLQSNNASACFSLGKIYKESKDFPSALSYFEKASKEQEFKLKALVERGTCLISMGDLERAQAEMERVLKLSTDETNNETIFARYLLAYCFEQQRKYEDALVQWQKIQAKKPNFRDVPAKLAQYQDLETDDHLKDFLTSGGTAFEGICKEIVETSGLVVHDVKEIANGLEIVAGESQAKWRNTKKLPTLFWFLQITDTVDESLIRSFNEKIKSNNMSRGILVISATYSRSAREFAESRPMELVDKDKLLTMLSKSNGK